MQTVRDGEGLAKALRAMRTAGETVALVPTMGALHEGHLALVAEAKRRADRVVVSIFVNPTQFNDPADLARYPREEEQDAVKLVAAGADLLWLPTAEQFYPDGYATTVSVKGISDRWEGAHRPGHFDGVATVVAKLFIAVMPDVAVFGEKDWQQLAVVRRMAADLGLPVNVVGLPTVRADDGLALSSRNSLLGSEERKAAVALAQSLNAAAAGIARGEAVGTALNQAIRTVKQAGFGPVDYLTYVDGATLEPLDGARSGGRLIAAAFLGKIRLIDNIRVILDTEVD
ncbi:pantoate--beta-alanine ligase [Sphingomonas jaspsi]|uniref:pantoate--beta-alanine ligase n=1 Tax=Sphingomonas jaspsi TaxID=392409 RepID=UPI0004BCA56D|nr:pantoate--beta-alanine ligase [Sphingomonas jaspsi]